MLPTWLTPPIAAIGLAVASVSAEAVTGAVPGSLVAVLAVADSPSPSLPAAWA